jgi:uncharacterized membrane protein
MTLKTYQKIKLAITMLIAIVFSQAIIFNNFLIPIIVLIVGYLVLMFLRRQLKEVIADERDYALAGKSASWAIQIYSWVAVVSMFVLYGLRDINPSYEPIAMTLAFSTCALMFTYSLIFNFHNKVKFTANKSRYLILVIILTIFLSIFTIRLFSGEDNWVCQNSQWVEHGHPSFPAPTTICK